MRNRSCCGWGSGSEKPIKKGDHPTPRKEARKHGAQNAEQHKGLWSGHKIVRFDSSKKSVGLQPSPVEVVAVPLDDEDPGSDVEMSLG